MLSTMQYTTCKKPFFFIIIALIGALASAKEPLWYTGGPWDAGLFSPDAAAVRRAADSIHYPGESRAVTILYAEGQTIYRADGSLESRSSFVYRIETDEGLKNWSSAELGWSPWHQDKPTIRARVINPDGSTYEVSEKDLMEVSRGSDDSLQYTDFRRFRVPFPNVVIGSVVEEEFVTVSRPLLAGSGLDDFWYFSRMIPVGRNKYTVTYPKGMNVSFKTYALGDVAQTSSEKDGLRVLTWEAKNQEPSKDTEDFAPPDHRQRSKVEVSNAPEWKTLATAYSAEIERVLSSDSFAPPKELNLPRKDPKAAIVAASRWINERVRYTGMELGLNSIVPYKPSEVIARGYGDCKDKATMLVALLRSAGYKAWVSLVNTGPGTDVDPELPGIGKFDHAIVFVEDGAGIWFDPTVELSYAATLPFYDQYRYSLIARPGQKSLVRTPEMTSADNLTAEFREIVMADSGKGSVVERTEYLGALDSYYRNAQLYKDPERTRKDYSNYLENYYGIKDAPRVEWNDPRDFSGPYAIVLGGAKTNKAFTEDTTAQAVINLNNLRGCFPSPLIDEKVEPRKAPFRLNVPFSYRLIATIKPPAGFKARGIPEPKTVPSEFFSYNVSWEAGKSGELIGTVRFEMKKVEFTPAQFEKAREDIKTLLDDNNEIAVVFDHEGEILRAEGKYAEAFDRYRALVRDMPTSAIQYKRLSNALLSYSMGEAASLYARKAVEIDPKDASLWENLANVLMCNPMGKRLAKGFDREGAIAAWKKAIELDGENKAYRANLAILYEYDAEGQRYQSVDDLKRSRAEYEALGKALDEYNLSFNLWIVLARLGDTEAAARVAAGIKDPVQRNIAKVVNEALKGNQAQPSKLLEQELALPKRQECLVAAADMLTDMRRYKDAARFLRQAAIANKDAGNLENRALVLDGISIASPADLAHTSPEGLVKSFICRYIKSPESAKELFDPCFSPGLLKGIAAIGEKRALKMAEETFGPVLGTGSPTLRMDIALSIMNLDVTGDDAGGYRAVVNFDGVNAEPFRFYIVREGREYRMAALNAFNFSIGSQISAFLDAKKPENAERWYNWQFPPARGKPEAVLDFAYFADERLPRNEWVMRRVAELLATQGLSGDPARKSIDALWKRLSNRDAFLADSAKNGVPADMGADLWATLTVLLSHSGTFGLAHDRARTIAAAAAPFLERDPDFTPWYAVNLALWGDYAEAERVAESWQAANPEDRGAFAVLVSVYQQALDFPKIDEICKKQSSRLTGMDLNNLAWAELFRNPQGELSPTALERSRKSVTMGQSRGRAELHTLATIYATIGRFDEAHSILVRMIEMDQGVDPRPEDWYVYGLIAEGYGFHDAAEAAWRKVVRDEFSIPSKTDTSILAQARLERAKRSKPQ